MPDMIGGEDRVDGEDNGGGGAGLPRPGDVLAAAKRISGHLPRTQTRPSPKLAALTGAREVYLKIDTSLHTSSFKERGALNAVLQLGEAERKAGVITASAGNHAQALAHHAGRLDVSAVVVMPAATPQVKVDGARAVGADVILHGEVFDDALAHARALAAEQGRTFVHAFDDARVIAGQGVAMLELVADAPALDMVVIPVGGGGLIGGCLLALEALSQEALHSGAEIGGGAKAGTAPHVPEILAVEPSMYPSMARALRGQTDMIVGGDTIAEGVAVKTVGGLTRQVVAERLSVDQTLDVTEAAIEDAVVHLAMMEKLVVEGAGALGLAAMLAAPERFAHRSVGLMVCGGNIDARLFGQVFSRHFARANRRARIRVDCSDQPGRLAMIANIIQDSGANVLDVVHDRLALDAPAKMTVIDFIVEIENAAVTTGVIERLQAAGFARARVIEAR